MIAAWIVILIATAATFLPLARLSNGTGPIGVLLIIAGIVEAGAGSRRHQARALAISAGLVTVAAGLLFFTDAAAQFVSSVLLVMAWLFVRSMLLAAASVRESGALRLWTGLSAFTDLTLAASLVIGLSASTLIVSLFGATPEIIASFAWLLAISFAVTGLMLLQIARCGSRQDI